jgi:phospholipase/carboxylesterase
MPTPVLPLHHLARPATAGSARPPLVLLLHGYGANEHDLFDLESALGQGRCVLSVRAPIPLDGLASFAWFAIGFTNEGIVVDTQEAGRSLATLIALIEQAPAAYGADPERVVLIGFSQGATMASLVALARPDLVLAAAVLSGIDPEPFLEAPPAPQRLAGLHMLVAHGTQDAVVPIDQGRAMRELAVRLGADVIYREYPIGHGIDQAGLRDLAAWIDQLA